MNNRALVVATIVLAAISVWTWRASVTQGERFERGQPFLAQLDLDEIAEIELTQGADSVTLRRSDDRFIVVEADGYRASNQTVNRLLRDLLELALERRVGRGGGLEEELELEPVTDTTVEVGLSRAGDQEIVRFRVGSASEQGSGVYIQRIDGDGGDIFLTTSRFSHNAEAKTYLDSEILNVARNEVASVRGADFELRDDGEGLKLQDVPSRREQKPSEVNRVSGVLSALRFDKVHLADADAVRGLRFDPLLEVGLKDGSGYRLALAETGGASYLQISGYHSVDRMMVGREETDEELQEKAEVLARADEIADFNRFHGSWVYEISEATADKMTLRKSDLLQEPSSP